MHAVKKFLTTEVFLVIFLSLFSLSLGMIPTLYRFAVTPKDRIFAGAEFYSDDYSVYLSYIQQGINGRWSILDKHTAEPHAPTIMHEEYLLIGKFAKLINIDQITAYHLSRFFLGAIFLLTVWYFLLTLFPPSVRRSHVQLHERDEGDQNKKFRLLSFFLFTTTASFPVINNDPRLLTKWHLSWFMEAEPIFRSTMLPHYLLGAIFFIISLIFFTKYLDNTKRKRQFLGALLTGNLLAFVHPVNLIILTATLTLFILGKAFSKANHRLLYLLKYAIPFISFVLLTSPFVLLFQFQMNTFPWNFAIKAWENSSDFYASLTNIKEYLLAMGPVSVLATIGIIGILSRLSRSATFLQAKRGSARNDDQQYSNITIQPFILILSWLLAFFLLLYFLSPVLHIAQLRFLFNPVLLPLSILAAIGIVVLLETTQIRTQKNTNSTTSSRRFVFHFVLFRVLPITLYILLLAPTYYFQMKSKLETFSDFSTLIYPTTAEVASFNWLAENSRPDEAVIAAYEVSSLLPFMSGNTIYAGQLWHTVNYEQKSKQAFTFFSGQLSEDAAKKFLEDNHIKYVYYGFQEKSAGGQIEKYPFLKPVFRQNDITIFQVI